jgi:hypothetical protein
MIYFLFNITRKRYNCSNKINMIFIMSPIDNKYPVVNLTQYPLDNASGVNIYKLSVPDSLFTV